ncbi:MAG: hypothetical protein WBP41_14765 [Saprospiraceae bacterium]
MMSKSDQWVNIILIGTIILYLSIWAIGYKAHKFAYLASIVNIVSGAAILLYWVIRQIQITQHIFELREILVLLFEVVVIACGIFYILSSQRGGGLKILQYLFFGIHLTVLVLGLIFMITFKMNRLM